MLFMTERAYRQFRNSNPNGCIYKIWWEYNPDTKEINKRYNLVVESIPLTDSFADFSELNSFAINNKFQAITSYQTGREPYTYMLVTKDKISYYAQYLLKRKHKELYNQQKEITKKLKRIDTIMNDINYTLTHTHWAH